jgi:hypothetical protein
MYTGHSLRYHLSMKPRVLFSALLALACMAGCNRSFISSFSQNQNDLCAPPRGTQTVLAYPAPGATDVPANIGEVVFASSTLLPGSYRAYLIDVTGSGGGGGKQVNFANVSSFALQSPPAGSATPPFSDAFYQASTNFQNTVFPSGHTIEVALQQVKCNTSGAYGYFTVR